MADKILHKRNLSAGNVPTTSSLDVGELAINVADGKLFLRQSGSIANKIITVGESASFASTASFVTSSNIYGPYGANSIISASYALQALSSSYANFATSASHTLFAETASNALNAQDILIYVLNNSGYNIPKGTVVHITASGNSSDTPRIISASYENDANSANTLGIANESIANGANGYVMTEGVLKGIDTSAFISGQMIYLGASGSIIGLAPQAPLHAVRLGQVVRVQQNNGSIYVRIDNGYELDELHDVRIMTASLQYGDLLMRSGSVWTNSKQLSGSYNLTGSLTISGSSTFTNIGPAIFSGSVTGINGFTGSLLGTSSWANNSITSSYVLNAVSASYASVANSVNDLNQNVFISGSLTVLNGATIYGSSSFQYVTASQLEISASFISVNVFEPVERFGGLKVYDSGSSTATASLAWDSLHNHWVYQNVDGASYTGGMLLSGPRNTGSLGDEPNLTKWFVPRSDGGDHLDNSQIFTSASITQVTGSLTVTAGITGSLSGNSSTATSASFAATSSVTQRVAVPLGSGYIGQIQANGTALDLNNSSTGVQIRLNSTNLTQFFQPSTFSNGVNITPGANSTTSGLTVTTGSYPSATLLRVGVNDLVVTGSRIGIGTTTPVDAVEIVGPSKYIQINGVTATDRSAWIGNGADGTGNVYLFNGTNTNTVFITGNGSSFFNGGNVGIGVVFQPSISASLHISGTNAATLLRLDAPGSSSILHVTGSGRVGIGTSTPASLLHLSAADPLITINNQSTSLMGFEWRSANTTYAYNGIASAPGAAIVGSVVGDLYFRTVNKSIIYSINNGASMQFIISSSGNVGIGTTTPNARLDVSGSAIITGTLTAANGIWDSTGIAINNLRRNTASTLVIDSDGGILNSLQFKATSTWGSISSGIVNGMYNSMTFQGTGTSTFNNFNFTGTCSTPTSGQINILAINNSITTTNVGSIVRGLYYNPTISIAGIHRAIETTTGDVIFGSTSGNVGIGTTTPNARLDVSGSAIITGSLTATQIGVGAAPSSSVILDVRASGSAATDTTFRIRNSTNTTTQFEVNGQGLTTIRTNGGGGANSLSIFNSSAVENFRVQENGVLRFRSLFPFDNNSQTTILAPINVTNSLIINSLNVYDTPNANRNLVGFTPSFTWGSGNNTGSILNVTPTINTSGGTNTIRGLYYNPTLTSTTGVTHRAIETTTGDVIFGSTSGNVGIGKTTPNARLDVAGTTVLSGSFNTATSGSILTVIGSGSAQPIFTVQGSQGELFSVTDQLSGSLFSVNDISGLPILEVFSDNTTLIGNYLDPMLITTAKVTQTNSGSFTVYALPTASYDTAFFEYSVKSGSNARAGTIMAIQSGSSVNFTETTTLDFGSTTAVSFTVVVTGSNMALTGSSTSGAWTIKAIVRGL